MEVEKKRAEDGGGGGRERRVEEEDTKVRKTNCLHNEPIPSILRGKVLQQKDMVGWLILTSMALFLGSHKQNST